MSCGKCGANGAPGAPQEGELIGKVVHYFDKAGVAIIELSSGLKVGDNIKIACGETSFTQPVESMEVEHQRIEEAKKGDSIGLKVSQKAKEGCQVYKL
jgi:translation elongation factor EF-1alpha